jgi:hypothetical protein
MHLLLSAILAAASLTTDSGAPVGTNQNSKTAGAAIEASGDFSIDDVLTPAPPAACDSPVLLIVSAGNGHWFAAGIPRNDPE